jgi:hypothetical protein
MEEPSKYHNIPGFFNFEEVYKSIIQDLDDDSTFVEVGTWFGKSITYAVESSLAQGKRINFVAVDTFEGSPEEPLVQPDGRDIYRLYLENTREFTKYITTLKLSSVEAARLFDDKSLDFVFIDGSHLYESVRDDIAAWAPKIKSGGIIAGHDYDTPEDEFNGVKKAVDEVFGDNKVTVYDPGHVWGKSWMIRLL